MAPACSTSATSPTTPGLLPEAKAAFEAATQVFTRDSLPLQWAFAVNNIGDVHWSLATRGGGKPDYDKAIELYESAKEGFKQAGYAPLIAAHRQEDRPDQAGAGEGIAARECLR